MLIEEDSWLGYLDTEMLVENWMILSYNGQKLIQVHVQIIDVNGVQGPQ